MYDPQDHIKHQEERQDQDEIDAHENWMLDEERNEADEIQFEKDFTYFKDRINEAPARLQERIRERLLTQNQNYEGK